MAAESKAPKMKAKGVDVWYGDVHAVRSVDLDIFADEVTALIGPSGCGKSTILRCFNRMNDTIAGCRVTGDILLENEPVYGGSMDVVQLRARVGMVFQKPNPFPKSVYDNVAYGPRIHGLARRGAELDEIVGAASSAPGSGRRSRTAWTSPARRSRAASSSACASRARSRSIPR